jgi:hypothetical protein
MNNLDVDILTVCKMGSDILTVGNFSVGKRAQRQIFVWQLPHNETKQEMNAIGRHLSEFNLLRSDQVKTNSIPPSHDRKFLVDLLANTNLALRLLTFP